MEKFRHNKSFFKIFIKIAIGVTIIKKIIARIIGVKNLPKNKPNLNHKILKGNKIFELIIPKNKKKIEIIKAQIFNWWP